ncbi:hypothetical protein NEF87_002928 [Candidatus Lokiarchaeum ossiferum]|uniref:Right-handed parallel beta-helix repeat-containing protein n=1 Tax=Candidatus Lokiarchaeum ossiferum TaxID=2951803 RepID=A0ABY6HT10_9ARCH|nr:hypothetical protein NEF87_002928 [Candidatus Lokiarchaeum sp. B-35]
MSFKNKNYLMTSLIAFLCTSIIYSAILAHNFNDESKFDTPFCGFPAIKITQQLDINGDEALKEFFTESSSSGKNWRSSFLLEFEGNLTLQNTNLHLIIQNSVISNIKILNCCNVRIKNSEFIAGYKAVEIMDSDSIEIIRNHIHDNVVGIHMEYTNNSILHNNIITHQSGDSTILGDGIYLLYCNNIEIQNNIANYNHGNGIYLKRSADCIIENNILNYNYGNQSFSGNGVILVHFCDSAQIINNTANYNHGMGERYSGNGIVVEHSDWSVLFHNTANYNNGTGIFSGNGIYTEVSNEVKTYENVASFNSESGFEIRGSIKNIICHNNFSSNMKYGINMNYPWETEVYENIVTNNLMGNIFDIHRANVLGDNSITTFEGIELEFGQKSIPSFNFPLFLIMTLLGTVLIIQHEKKKQI